MRNYNYKGRCVKVSLPKFSSVCRTFDNVQHSYAVLLSTDNNVMEVKCNVLIEDTTEGKYCTDFVITKSDGKFAVRECVLKSHLCKPRMVKLLDLSQRYWMKHGVTDWKVVIEDEKE